MSIADDIGTTVPEMSRAEGRQLLEDAARRRLGMTADEFLAAWDAGQFGDQDSAALHEVAALIPFGR